MRATRPLLFLMMLLLTLPLSARDPLAQRIGHHDPSRYRAGRSHGSVGDMSCMTLLPGNALITSLYFLHRCQITPGGGVGYHFHNTTEEMFVIFDGEAEFTVDGRAAGRGGRGAAAEARRLAERSSVRLPPSRTLRRTAVALAEAVSRTVIFTPFALNLASVGSRS